MSSLTARDLTKMALLVALLFVAAFIAVPLPFTPAMITMTTLVFNLTAFLLPPKQTLIVCVVYTLCGAAGLPVFTGGVGGLGKLFGPTGGFIFAFIVAYPLVSMFKGKVRSFWHYVAAGVFIGIPITYIGGVLGMMIVLHMSLWPAIVAGALPFIPGDILKTIVAAFIALKIRV